MAGELAGPAQRQFETFGVWDGVVQSRRPEASCKLKRNRMKVAAALLTLSFTILLMAVGVAGPPPKSYPTAITHVPAEKRVNAITKGNVAGQGTNELIPRDMALGVRVSLGKK